MAYRIPEVYEQNRLKIKGDQLYQNQNNEDKKIF